MKPRLLLLLLLLFTLIILLYFYGLKQETNVKKEKTIRLFEECGQEINKIVTPVAPFVAAIAFHILIRQSLFIK